jgi:hypothetical protein
MLVCTANSGFFPALGEALYRSISPHLNEDLDVTQSSTIPEQKKQLKV